MTIDTKAMRIQAASAFTQYFPSGDVLSLCDEVESLRADVTHWIMVADGINHDPRCSNHFAGDLRHGLCMRCKREGLLAAVMDAGAKGDALADALTDLANMTNELDCESVIIALAAWRGR